MAKMLAHDFVLKTLLEDGTVSEEDLTDLTIYKLHVFLKHKDVLFKSGMKKADYAAMALKAMVQHCRLRHPRGWEACMSLAVPVLCLLRQARRRRRYRVRRM